jgi:cation:H+ antiporter
VETFFIEIAQQAHWSLLAGMMIFSIMVLGKSADIIVDNAVELSTRWGVPKLIIGATIVSLGTTFPEVVVSVLAAVQGQPGLALGNAVGSIVCDTGLIMGIGCLIGNIPVTNKVIQKQSWLQLGAGFLLVAACFPFSSPKMSLRLGSFMEQEWGFIFLALLVGYLLLSINWARKGETNIEPDFEDDGAKPGVIIGKIVVGLVLLAISSQALIANATEVAVRLSVPEAVVAATLVAFGTSLPELITVVSAVRKNHGEIAIGNVIGADILNVLLVAGASASVTQGGLIVPPEFFYRFFPAMLLILAVFKIGISTAKKGFLGKGFGVVLLTIYILTSVSSLIGKG